MIKATVNQSIYEVKEGTTLSDLAKQVQLQIADYFTAIIPNEGDPYYAFAQQLSAAPNECIALATTPADIAAINQAHLISIGIGDAELLSAADYQVAQTGDLRYPMLRKVWEDHHENK